MSPHLRATLVGFSAILMWSLLSLLTVASGRIPPFQLAAMTFAIGGGLGAATWAFRRGAVAALRQKPEVWALGVMGLFGYHALYFMALRLAPPAEAQLVNYLWPLLIVLFSALLPNERLRPHHVAGVLLGLAGTIVLFIGRGGIGFALEYLPGFAAALVAAFAWATYSVLSRRFPDVPTDAVAGFCLATAAPVGDLPPRVRDDRMAGQRDPMARHRGARHRAGGRCVLCLGHRREARRHPRAGRDLLCGADPVDLSSGARRLRGGQRLAHARGGAHHGRRAPRRQGSFYREGGDQPGGASSNTLNSNPGATVQPTSVQSPRLTAACQAPAGTTACGCSPATMSAPSRTTLVPSTPAMLKRQGRARVVVPDLDRIDPVPVRALAAREQEIDRRRGGTPAVDRAAVPERLAVVSALGVGPEIEQADDVRGAERLTRGDRHGPAR